MTPAAEKKQIRLAARKNRARLSRAYRCAADAAIADQLFQSEFYRNAGTVFLFYGVKDEIQTDPIICRAWNDGKTVAVAKCLSDHRMSAKIIRSMEDLEDVIFGLKEPKESTDLLLPDQIDLTLVPCLSADESGHRIGQGGGYYDRYLKQVMGTVILLCREKEIVSYLPQEETDYQFSFLLSEEGLKISRQVD